MGHSFPSTPSWSYVKRNFICAFLQKSLCFSALSSHFSAFYLWREASDSFARKKLSLEVSKNLRKMDPARSLRVFRFISSTNCEIFFFLETVIWDPSLDSFWWKRMKVTRFLSLTNIVSKLINWHQKRKCSIVASAVIQHQNCSQFLKFHFCVELYWFLLINL